MEVNKCRQSYIILLKIILLEIETRPYYSLSVCIRISLAKIRLAIPGFTLMIILELVVNIHQISSNLLYNGFNWNKL